MYSASGLRGATYRTCPHWQPPAWSSSEFEGAFDMRAAWLGGAFRMRARPQNERMSCQRPNENGNPNHAWKEPVRQGRQRTPKRQVWPVIHIERGEQQDVGNGHAAHVHAEPLRSGTTFGHSADNRGAGGANAQRQEVVVG